MSNTPNRSNSNDDVLALPARVVEAAQKAGATVAESVYRDGFHLSAKVRMREPELVEEAGSRSIGLRLMIGQKVAQTSTSDLSDRGLARLVDDAIELATLAEADPFAGAPDPSLLSKASEHVDLDSYDELVNSIDAASAVDRALAGELAAFQYDPRITNSEGATFTRASGRSALVTSGGFSGTSRGTSASIVVSPLADDVDGKKQGSYYWDSRRKLASLHDPAAVGIEAARRTVRKLGATKIDSAELPVVFDPDAGRSIIGLLAGCVLGSSIWRKSSYLADKLGERVASDLITLVDDPFIPSGPGSRAFDGEGLLSRRNVVVENGILRTYLLDSYSGRKLGRESTASASRGGAGGVGASTTNFILRAGSSTAASIIRETKRGLYVTDMMGYGFSAVTGDFSRGASGFLIVDGELGPPVSEVTISLNLDEMLKRIDRVGDDLDLRTSTACPTFRISAMTIAGR
jgi:PmbA protein